MIIDKKGKHLFTGMYSRYKWLFYQGWLFWDGIDETELVNSKQKYFP